MHINVYFFSYHNFPSEDTEPSRRTDLVESYDPPARFYLWRWKPKGGFSAEGPGRLSLKPGRPAPFQSAVK